MGLGRCRKVVAAEGSGGAEACARIEEAMHGADPPGDLEELCRRARLDEGEAAALLEAP